MSARLLARAAALVASLAAVQAIPRPASAVFEYCGYVIAGIPPNPQPLPGGSTAALFVGVSAQGSVSINPTGGTLPCGTSAPGDAFRYQGAGVGIGAPGELSISGGGELVLEGFPGATLNQLIVGVENVGGVRVDSGALLRFRESEQSPTNSVVLGDDPTAQGSLAVRDPGSRFEVFAIGALGEIAGVIVGGGRSG